MADRKISDLTALTTPAAGDYLPIIDISESLAANKNKRITIEELLRGAPDGTAAAPSFAFESDGGNGFYLAGTDTIGASTNGVNRLTLSTSALTSTVPISATSFTPTSSTVPTNGVYLPAANSVAISTNGTGRLFVDASGNVGVGTTPVAPLNVKSATDSPANIVGFFTGGGSTAAGNGVAIAFSNESALSRAKCGIGNVRVNTFDRSDLVFYLNNDAVSGSFSASDERLRITSDGKLGLGTSSPRQLLDVQGSLTFAGSQAGPAVIHANSGVDNAALALRAGTTASVLTQIDVNSGWDGSPIGGWIAFKTANTERARFTSTGLGVGTTSPSEALTVEGNLALTASDAARFSIKRITSPLIQYKLAAGNYFLTLESVGTSQGGILFNTGTTAATERARITSSGQLLVGTSSARNLGILEVEGTTFENSGAVFCRNANGSGATAINICKSRGTSVGSTTAVQSGDALGSINFRGADGSNLLDAAKIQAEVDGTPGANDMPGRLVFSTTADGASSPTERLRITSAGLVGIGTSSPADYGGNLVVAAASPQLTVADQSVQAFITLEQRSNVAYLTRDDGDIFQIGTKTDSSQTSITPQVTIDTSGNVGIGTTSPGYKLEVGGTLGNFGVADNGCELFFTRNANNNINANGASATLNFISGVGHVYSVGGSERARIDSSGRLLVGTSTSIGNFSSGLQVVGNGNSSTQLLARYDNNDSGPFLHLTKSRSGTVGTNTVVQNGDELGTINFVGADGTNYLSGARIASFVDGTPGTNDLPTRLVFSVSGDGSASPTEALRITNDRYVRLASGTGGIQFNGDTAAANALDDYEEGTWTATISGISVDSSGYSTYTKIGNTVFVRAHLNVNGNPGDTFTISGLPFTSSSSCRCAATLVVQDSSDTFAQISGPTAIISNSVSNIGCDLHGAITLANNDRLNIFASYFV